MKTKTVGTTTLALLLLAAASAGSSALIASSLAITIASLYGTARTLARRAIAMQTRASVFGCLAGATIAACSALAVVSVWSSTVGISVLDGVAAWTLILSAGEVCGLGITLAERRRTAFIRMRLGFDAC